MAWLDELAQEEHRRTVEAAKPAQMGEFSPRPAEAEPAVPLIERRAKAPFSGKCGAEEYRS